MLTSEFVTEVRRQGSIPDTYSAADILLDGDREVRARFIPLLEELRQNYLVRTLETQPDGRGRVPIPDRAVGAALRSVQVAVSGGWVPIPQRDLTDADFAYGGTPCAYFIDGGSIALLPSGSSGQLRIRYASRPGKMVLDTDGANAGRIDSLIVGASTYTITTSPVFTGGSLVDVVSYGPAHQQKAIGTTRAGLVLQISAFQEAPLVGDWMCTFDTSPLVPLPEELSSALVHRTAAVILRSLAYAEEASQQAALAEEVIQAARPMLIPRNEGNPQPIRGGLRRALGLGRRW